MDGLFVFFVAVVVLGVIGTLFCLIMLRRNNKVCRFRVGIIDRIAALNQADIFNGRADYEYRWKQFGRVTYDEMCWRFWVPLKPERWWADTSFLEEGRKG